MFPLVYTNMVAGSIFLVACLIWVVPEWVGVARQNAKATRKDASIQDHSSMGILIGLLWFGVTLNFFLAWLFPAAAIPWQRMALFIIGVVLILLGVVLRWYAIWVLGIYFTRDVAVSANQKVVQTGPYRLIRHPAYSGTFLTMAGMGLAMANWASLVALLLCVFAGHMYRVNIEEKVLVQTLGLAYVEYMRRTKRFIPWIF